MKKKLTKELVNGAEPTLSELIEACGEKFLKLETKKSYWYAHENETGAGFVGLTPEEAVTNLWFRLNPNKKLYGKISNNIR